MKIDKAFFSFDLAQSHNIEGKFWYQTESQATCLNKDYKEGTGSIQWLAQDCPTGLYLKCLSLTVTV